MTDTKTEPDVLCGICQKPVTITEDGDWAVDPLTQQRWHKACLAALEAIRAEPGGEP